MFQKRERGKEETVEKRLEGQKNMVLKLIDLESSEIDGHGHVEVDGCPSGGGEDGRRHI